MTVKFETYRYSYLRKGKPVFVPSERGEAIGRELKAKVEADGKEQQKSYDKYACWCEKTLGRKAADIANAKDALVE